MQQSFLPEIEDLMKLCPLCKKNNKHYKVEKVKAGNTFIDCFGRYIFSQTGWRNKITEWWSCKECAKKVPTDKYMDFLINNQHILIN